MSPPDRDGALGGVPPRRPLFVERQTYRRRRIRDAIRALPALGLLLWMVPLIWPQSAEQVRSSTALLFVFGVWLGLVVVAAALVAILNRGDKTAARQEDEAGP